MTQLSKELLSRGDALRMLDEIPPEALLGFDGFRRPGEGQRQPDAEFCFDMEEALTSEADLELVASAPTERDGRFLVARRIIEEAPEDLWFELALR